MPATLVVRTAGAGDLAWVLLAGNGRPLARSASVFRNGDDLSAAWRELVADREALNIRLDRDGAGPDWWWTAALPARRVGAGPAPGVVVARSARGYLRLDQCRGGAAGFVRVLSDFARRPR